MDKRVRGTGSELYGALGACSGALLAAVIFSFFLNLLMLVTPLYMLQVFDRVLSSRSEATLLMLTLIAAFLLLVLGVLDAVRARVLVRTAGEFEGLLKDRVFGAIFERSLRVPGATHTQGLQDLDSLRQFLTGRGVLTLLDAPWAPIFIVVTFLLHWWLGVLSLVGALMLFALTLANEALTRKPLADASKAAVEARHFAEASVNNAEVLSAMGMLLGIRGRWSERRVAAVALQALAIDRSGMILASTKFLRLFLQVLALGLGAYLVLKQTITPGAMIAGSILMSRALAPVEQAVGNWRSFLAARSAFARLRELLDVIPPPLKTMALPKPTGQVWVERVVTVAPGGRPSEPILRNVSFQLAPGEMLGIIGRAAAGKSTLARVLVGVWPVFSGHVRLDGTDVCVWNQTDLGKHIGYLPQDVELFDGTVAENIARFGDVDADAVILAGRRAGVHEIIQRLPQGYDTLIGEGGRVLSGGQRQGIAFARALYKEPALLVLDDPDSSLDGYGERALVQALTNQKAEGKTLIVIAHRSSLLARADKILVLSQGVVETYGPRDQVMATYALLAKQHAGQAVDLSSMSHGAA